MRVPTPVERLAVWQTPSAPASALAASPRRMSPSAASAT